MSSYRCNLNKGEIIELVSGAHLFKFHGFTYSIHSVSKRGNTRYKCSSRMKHNCRAYIVADCNRMVLAGDLYHEHNAPSYIMHHSGKFSLDLSMKFANKRYKKRYPF